MLTANEKFPVPPLRLLMYEMGTVCVSIIFEISLWDVLNAKGWRF